MIQLGDNLEVMKSIDSNSVNLIYADILYGTGRDFSDYKDISSNRKEVEDFYIDRIKEMHRIMKPDSSIYLQMDNRISHYIRILIQDTFGVNNFRNQIIYMKRTTQTNSKTNYYPKVYDIILFFTKSDKYTFNIQRTPISSESESRYNKVDENNRNYMTQGIKKKNYNKRKTLIFNGKEYTDDYSWSQETLDKRISEGIIVEENTLGELGFRRYLDNNTGKQLNDLWIDIPGAVSPILEYQTQKPLNLMERIVTVSSNENDLLFDPFMGSGSFLVAGKKLNRKVSGCDINPNAVEITKRRLKELNKYEEDIFEF